MTTRTQDEIVNHRLRAMDRMLRPNSVAVVGASPNPSFVSNIFKNLLRYGYEGSVVGINPRYEQVLNAPCYPSVLDVPHPLDLVVVGVAARLIPTVLDQCEQKGVRALEIVSSGFGETGAEGARRQAELAAWARRTGIPVGGPNCLGLMHAPSGLVALPTAFEKCVSGSVGLALQSGMVAPSVLVPLFSRGIGITFAITSGNEADLEAADYIRYFVDEDETRIIGCFAEQIKTPERFIAACELAADRDKPIVMLKIGRSAAGQRAALAHTGSLVGSDEAVDALLRKLGVTRVHTIDDMLECLAIFHARRRPRGNGVGAVFVSGGAVGLLSDLAPECGVSFPPLPEETARRLREVVPEYGSVGNPLDITGQGVFETDILKGSLELLAETGDLHTIIYGRGFPSWMDRQNPVGQVLEQAVEKHPEVLFLVMSLVGGHFHPAPSPDMPVLEPFDRLEGVPFLQGSGAGLRAVAALVRYVEFQRARLAGEAPASARVGPEVAEQARARLRSAGGRSLVEREGKEILALYGISTALEVLATNADEAAEAAPSIGYPVALKVESADVLHKSEAGAVLLDLQDEQAVRKGFERILENVRQKAPGANVRGVLVQKMIRPATEVILGMSRDPQFGPVIACGLGGILVETLKDVAFMLPPVSEAEARSALERLRGYPVLLGTRGSPPADVDALVDVLLRFSQFCQDLGGLVQEVDINPLMVRPAGGGAVAVDCLIVPVGA